LRFAAESARALVLFICVSDDPVSLKGTMTIDEFKEWAKSLGRDDFSQATCDLSQYFIERIDEHYFAKPSPAKRILFTKFCNVLRKVDLILGHDIETGNVFLAYGKDVIQALSDGKKQSISTMILVNLRQATPELEILLTTLNAVKGSNDYNCGETGHAVEWLEKLFVLSVDGMTRTKCIADLLDGTNV
jgi:hypothetical protein